MPNVLFVIPPCFIGRELDFEIGFPVHLAILARVARQEGWSANYLDMTLEEKDGLDSFAQLAMLLQDKELQLVGITNHTVRTSVTTRAVAEQIKSIRPDVKVVVGGVNATFMWRELLEWCSAIDFILRGYGQPGLRGLLKRMNGAAVEITPGLVSRCLDDFRVEPIAAVTPEDFASPSLDGLPVARYLEWTHAYPLLTHTGCGFSCNFCTSVMPGPYQNLEVYRPPADVVAEMIQAVDLGFKRFFFCDNVFTSNRARCLELCNAIRAAGIPDRSDWVCMTRVEFVDEKILWTMRSAGCLNIAFGVESAGPAQWKSLRKGRFAPDTIHKAFSLTRRAGIGSTAYLMLGNPFQTQEDIDATADLIREVDPDYRVVSFFQPFPGTPYWSSPESFGLSDIAPLEQWNFHEAPICKTKSLSKSALMEAATRFYLERSVASSLIPSVDSLTFTGSFPKEYGDVPEPVRDAFSWADGTRTVTDILDRVCKAHGTRGRLIALYWLAAANREGTIQLLRRPEEGAYA